MEADRAIRSVLAQTWKSLEVIVVDDASDGGTPESIQRHAREGNIRLIRNPSPLGGSGARNRGIDESKGEWISFLDDDDEFFPEKIERQVVMAQSHGYDVVFCGYLRRGQGPDLPVRLPPEELKYLAVLRENFSPPVGIVRRTFLEREKIRFDTSLPSCQDWDFHLRLFDRAAVGSVAQALYIYYKHGGPSIGTSRRALEGYGRFFLKHRRRYFRAGMRLWYWRRLVWVGRSLLFQRLKHMGRGA